MPEYEELNFSHSFRDEEDVTEPEYPHEGQYHFNIAEVDASGESFAGAVFFTMEILAGNVEGQQGKTVKHVIWPPREDARNPANAKKRWMKDILRLMLAFGLRKAGEFPTVKINKEFWEQFVGKQCVAKVTLEVQKRNTESGKRVEWIQAKIVDRGDFFPIGDDAVSDVPLDQEAAKIGGYLESEDI